MIKTNLPIIFLKDVVLLPNNDLRIEFSNTKDKNLLTISEMNYDGYLLFINLKNPKEEQPSVHDLPKIGILGKIKTKIELPNNIIRTVITGINRVNILEYVENNNNLEAFITLIEESNYDAFEVAALKRILLRDLNNYINISSYMSNGVLGRIESVKNLNALVDIIANELPLEYCDKFKYISETNSLARARYLIEDLNKEIETIKLEDSIEENLKTSLDNNQKEYILKEKIKLIKEELGESDIKEELLASLKTKIVNLEAPYRIKERLEKELNKYELTPTTSPETTIISTYIDTLMSLPWEKTTKDNTNLEKIKDILNESHFGLEEVKARIIEYVAVNKHTPNKENNIICLVGPPGTGKTTLAKEIATALNKKFVKISVGGVNDEAEIVGHRRTYIGASPGKIISGLKKCGSKNPVFLIDEIDKMTKDIKGDPASALLDVLDKEQNNMFVDNYIEEEFDLSKVMFILTANDEYAIPKALKDRLEIIRLSSYTLYEKINICKNYIIPSLLDNLNLKGKLKIDENVIEDIIKLYTKEAGVRELQRQITKIFRKKILAIVSKKDNELLQITKDNLKEYLGEPKYLEHDNVKYQKSGIVTALAYTPFGGACLKVTSAKYKGKGNIEITGNLGEVMKESVKIAISYIKSNCDIFGIDIDDFNQNDIHIHFEDGAIPKDGPSAGVAITTALISLFKDKLITNQISMSGEITLRGDILRIGGVKEKIISAITNNIKTIYLPKENISDVDELNSDIKDNINIKFVNNYEEIYKEIFK